MKRDKERKILFITPLPPPVGGIASWTKRIIENGLPGGYQISLVNTQLHAKRKLSEKTTFTLLEVKRTLYILGSLIKKNFSENIVCVHLNCSLSHVGVFRDLLVLILSRLFGVPVVTHYRGNIPDFSFQSFSGLSKKCLDGLVKFSHANIALNHASYQAIKAMKHKKCLLLPNFIEDALIENTSLENQLSRTLIFAGSITRLKGFLEIIEVAKQLPDVKFLLLGEIKKDVHPFLSSLPKNIEFLGVHDHATVIKKMSSANLFFFPSHTEGFPNAVLEAMAVGLPIVATRVGSIPEMIDQEQGGILVDVYDTTAMVEAIQRILNHCDLQKQMGIYNKQKCRSMYAYSVVSKQLVYLYDQVSQKICAE